MKASIIVKQLQTLIDIYGDHEIATSVTTDNDKTSCTDTIDIKDNTVLFDSGWYK